MLMLAKHQLKLPLIGSVFAPRKITKIRNVMGNSIKYNNN